MSLSDFDVFDEELQILEATQAVKSKAEKTCSHPNTIVEGSFTLCEDCGVKLSGGVSVEREWRHRSSNTNRCHIRKSSDRGIYTDVQNMGFPEKIVSEANKLYLDVTADRDKQKICRGSSRRAIIFACIYNTYKLNKQPLSCDTLMETFGLTKNKKVALRGLKYVNLHAPKNSPIRTMYITPANLIHEIMNKFEAKEEQKQEVVDLYERVKGKSDKLRRSRPNSSAAALVWAWICLKGVDISISEFTSKVNLSELTITKLKNEIVRIVDNNPP